MLTRDAIRSSLSAPPGAAPVDWVVAPGLVPYLQAVATMEARAGAIAQGEAGERVWLLEHPPLYTAGTGTAAADGARGALPVYQTGRGGQITYHGPGQRVAYVMLDLGRRAPDLRAYVAVLEGWLIATLARFGVVGERREDRVGVWVRRDDKPAAPDGSPAEDKIAAIGIRVRRWVTFHGVSLNVTPDLTHYAGIAPCGINAPRYGVTSLADLGVDVTMVEVDAALRDAFEPAFGPTRAMDA